MISTKCFVFRFSDVEVHESELRATRAGQALEIEPKAFRVLVCLVQHAGHLVTKSELMEAVWGETAVTENSLTRAIAVLRRVLEDDPHQPRFIETVSTAGYRFICPVSQETDGSGSLGESAPGLNNASAGQSATSAAAEVTATTSVQPRRSHWPWTLAAGIVVAVGIAAAAWWEWWSVYPVPRVASIDRITNDGLGKGFLATDGSRVYFFKKAKNQKSAAIAEVSTSGGDISIIPTPFVYTAPLDITPDKSSLLILQAEQEALWILPLPKGAPRRIGNLIADFAAFTPDGKQVIFTHGAEISISDVDGSQTRKIWTAPGDVYNPRVSREGKRVRFQACDQSGCPLWEVKTDGSGAHPVLPGWQGPPYENSGPWSPDGRYEVFVAQNQKGAYHSDLWAVPERRGWFSRKSEPVRLTGGPLCFAPQVAFSPDGQTMFAVAVKDDSELVRYDPRIKRAVPFLPGVPATLVDFSRDGQWVVYVTSPYASLWRSRRDGSERVQLTSSDDSDAGIARWSPDGTRIAFEWSRVGHDTKLGLVSRDGGTPEQVVPDKEDSHEQSDPTWSPDGNEIIYARDWGRKNEEHMELLRVDLQTRKVTSVPDSEGLFSPRWSPDGRYLAAFTVDQQTIRLFDFQRQVWTTWFKAHADTVGSNRWSPDSRALYFLNRKTNDAPLAWWRIALSEKIPTKIMELPDERILGWWYGLEPDGSSSYFTRDLTSTEIYAMHLSDK